MMDLHHNYSIYMGIGGEDSKVKRMKLSRQILELIEGKNIEENESLFNKDTP